MLNSRRYPGSLRALPWILTTLVALCTGAGYATAASPTFGLGGSVGPIIDGKGDDLISFAAGLTGRDCGLNFDDARDDISIADPKIVVCSPFEDTDGNAVPDYFINGFDVRRFVFAYDRPNIVTVSPTSLPPPGTVTYGGQSFVVAPRFTFGNAGRNSLVGPGYAALDGMVSRNVAIGYRRTLTLRLEIFNALNRTNYQLPDTFVDHATFGRSLAAFPPRQIQLAARIAF